MNHPIDFLAKTLGEKIVREMESQLVGVSSGGHTCDCCERASSEWANSEVCFKGKFYGVPEVHCSSCHVLYFGSFTHLGLEGYRGKKDLPDDQKSPVATKLGMLPGVGALITESKTVLYAPGLYYDKFSSAPDPAFDQVKQIGGVGILLDAFPILPNEPYLLITSFGKKKKDFVRNLKLSSSPRNVSVCSEMECIDLSASDLDALGPLAAMPKKDAKKWLELLGRSTYRSLSIDEGKELQELSLSNTHLATATKSLPVDPHKRSSIVAIIKKELSAA